MCGLIGTIRRRFGGMGQAIRHKTAASPVHAGLSSRGLRLWPLGGHAVIAGVHTRRRERRRTVHNMGKTVVGPTEASTWQLAGGFVVTLASGCLTGAGRADRSR